MTGFSISALEPVCTDQVYLPTITFVMGVEGMRPNALSYLMLCNLMFVTPLLVVFGFVYWGTTSIQLGGLLQRHLMPVKLVTNVLLFGLGIWQLFSALFGSQYYSSSHDRSGHVSPRLAGISIVLPYSARSRPLLGLDWQIQTGGLNNYGIWLLLGVV